MSDKTLSFSNQPQKTKKTNSIYRSLIFWFLLLALIPLISLSLINYYQARASLTAAAKQQLNQSALLSNHFLHDWFKSRLNEIDFQTKIPANTLTLEKIERSWQQSKLPLTSYVRTNDWATLTQERRSYFRKLIDQYDFLHDVFLIDAQENIVFTVDQEIELGTNLINGILANTQLSTTVADSLATKQALFSGLERYQHANLMTAGFISAPLRNNNKQIIGAIVFHLTIDPIFNLLTPPKNTSSITHYLVASDGLLRSPFHNDLSTVLTKKIATEPFKHWQHEQMSAASQKSIDHLTRISEYLGPDNNRVLGIHQTIKLLNVKWVLISEISTREAYTDANWLAYVSFALLIVTVFFISLIAIVQSRRITRPINQLAQASLKAAVEKNDMQIEIAADNEIGVLADSLNHMLAMRKQQALDIRHSHQQTQQALADLAEQKYALDQHSIVAITDRKGTITFVNQKFSEISGYSQAELVGQNHRILNSGFHHKQMWTEMYQLINRGLVWNAEICNKAKDGHLYWVDTTIVPHMDEKGSPKSFIAIRTDITKRKQIEKVNQQNTNQLELVVNNTGVGFWDWDIIAGTVDCNNRWYEITGYSRAQLKPFTVEKWSALIHPDDLSKALQIIQQHFDQDIEQYFCELRLKHNKGHWVWVLDSGKLVSRTVDGEPERMVGTLIDITHRKRTEQTTQIKLAVAKSLAQHVSLKKRLDNAIDELFKLTELQLQCKGGVFLLPQGKTELEMCSHRGEFSAQFLCDEKKIALGCCLCGKSAQAGKIIISNNCFTDHRHENSWPNMQAHGHYIIPLINHAEEQSTVVGVLFLYTEVDPDASDERLVLLQEIGDMFSATIIQENARSLLKKASQTADQNSQLKSEFLASMSHEIRTPMNGVLGMLGLLENSELNKDQAHKVGLAKSSAEALLTLINDILDFSKVEAGKLELEIIDFDLRKMLGEFAEAMALRAQEKGLEIILDTTNIDQSMVKGDPGRLRQILTNLVGNAIKFTDAGEILIRVATTLNSNNSLTLHASIKDTGIGIPADKINSLFDTFTQVDTSTTRKYGGTGLGLSICKKLCQLMNGDVHVTSELQQGSCFTFKIILNTSTKSSLVSPSTNINSLRLLVVDDNMTNLTVLKKQLEHWGAKVTTADSALKALERCQQLSNKKTMDAKKSDQLFDAALIDMQMPEINGVKLGNMILTSPELSQMKLIMMTAISNSNKAQFFDNIGFSGFFPKPATTADLLNALALIMNDHKVNLADNTKTLKNPLSIEKIDWPENVRLLLVEDNRINQQVALGVLKQFKLTADVANNGVEAIKLLLAAVNNKPYSLILMDCQMPVLDGYHASQQIREGKAGYENLSIPIIAMTANAMQGDREKCLTAGMSDYLSKPIDPDLLAKKLTYWLNANADDQQLIKQAHHHPAQLSQQASLNNPTETKAPHTAPLIWNKQTVMKRVSNKEALLKMLINNFIIEIPELLKQLPNTLIAHDNEQISQQLHTIKGVVGNLSGEIMHNTCKEIAVAIKANDPEKYQQLLSNLTVNYQTLVVKFNQYLQNSES